MNNVTYLHPGQRPEPIAARPVLKPHAALDLDQAELFLLELDTLARDVTTLPRAMYLLGLAEGHLANMIELVRGLSDVRDV